MQSVSCLAISQCIHLLEEHEDDLTQWYFSEQKENLLDWLCVERVLDENERGTLYFHSLPHHEFDAFDNQSVIIHWSLEFRGIKEEGKLIYIFSFLDCLNASTELPADYYSFMQDTNSSEPVKPTIPIREERQWEL